MQEENNLDNIENNEAKADEAIQADEILQNDNIAQVDDISQVDDILPSDDFSDEDFEIPKEKHEKLVTVRPVKFEEFEQVGIKPVIKKNLDIMQDVVMHVSVEIGKTKSSIREVMELSEGSIVELDKIAGEQVEIYVNKKMVAKGEVIVIEDKFGVRVTTTSLPKVIED